MTEHDIVRDLVIVLRRALPEYVVFKHADTYRHGIPDISATGDQTGSWWEVKHANPTFKTKGVQYETCRRLARAGICYYVIFAEEPQPRTIIIPPSRLLEWRTWNLQRPTFDYEWVASFIRHCHLN